LPAGTTQELVLLRATASEMLVNVRWMKVVNNTSTRMVKKARV
jgi:hypothetical protein